MLGPVHHTRTEKLLLDGLDDLRGDGIAVRGGKARGLRRLFRTDATGQRTELHVLKKDAELNQRQRQHDQNRQREDQFNGCTGTASICRCRPAPAD